MKCQDIAGDHLFVDRVTYNFRPPNRGEIIVFETHDIGNQYWSLPPDQFYIKRMVALGGEHVRIGNDRHLVIDGKRLDASTPHFENVYSFDPKQPPHESQYSGHVNQTVAARTNGRPGIAPLFPDRKHRLPTMSRRPLHGHGRQHLQQLRLPRLGRFHPDKCHREIFSSLLALQRPLRLECSR